MSGSIEYKEPADANVKLAGHEETVSGEATKMPLVKLAVGPEGNAAEVSNSNPMPMAMVGTPSVTVSGTTTVQGTVGIFGTVQTEVNGTVNFVDQVKSSRTYYGGLQFTNKAQDLVFERAVEHNFVRWCFRNASDTPVTATLSRVSPMDANVVETQNQVSITIAAGAADSIEGEFGPFPLKCTLDSGWEPASGGILYADVFGWK